MFFLSVVAEQVRQVERRCDLERSVGGGGGTSGVVKNFVQLKLHRQLIPIIIGAGGIGTTSAADGASGGYSQFLNSNYRANGGLGGLRGEQHSSPGSRRTQTGSSSGSGFSGFGAAGGNGGVEVGMCSFNGIMYAGGGAGGGAGSATTSYSGGNASNGGGVGGNGGTPSVNPTAGGNATANTGGGGGGGGGRATVGTPSKGGNGGSGVYYNLLKRTIMIMLYKRQYSCKHSCF